MVYLVVKGEPVVLNKQQIGGGGVMVWSMIFANGNIWLEWLKGRQNSESYKQLLDEKALPRIRREMGNILFYSKTIAASMCQNSWKNGWLKWIWLLGMACKKPRSKFNRKCLGNALVTCLWWTWNNERGLTMGTNTRSQKTTNRNT